MSIFSEETRKRMSLAAKRTWSKPGHREKISKIMKEKESSHNDKHPSWKGEGAKYRSIHSWIARNYGKANKCENKNCEKKSKYYDWALIKGKQHAHDINNYMMLCKSCHLKYDNHLIGFKHSEETCKKMSIRMFKYWENKRKQRGENHALV